MMPSDNIQKAYKSSKNIYNDVLTQKKWWSRLYINTFWGGVDDNEIAKILLDYIPKDFNGELLDVPVGTGIFTFNTYKNLNQAKITCLDYSKDMLVKAQKCFNENNINNVNFLQGDISSLPFKSSSFDIVISMNGFHAFKNKTKANSEINRVLKNGGIFIGCFYIKGENKITDFIVKNFLSKKGWFSPPFETSNDVYKRLINNYSSVEFYTNKSMCLFNCIK